MESDFDALLDKCEADLATARDAVSRISAWIAHALPCDKMPREFLDELAAAHYAMFGDYESNPMLVAFGWLDE